MTQSLSLGEPADEADWRALAEKALKGAKWESLVARTADAIAIAPLYREPDCPTAQDVSGFPGAAPFVRGASAEPGWLIRQRADHPDPARANADILADLEGGAGSIELVIDPEGENGVAIRDRADLDAALAAVIIEAAPIALDAGSHGIWAAALLAAKLKGAAAAEAAFNIDPIGALMRGGEMGAKDVAHAAAFAVALRDSMPAASALRVDARAAHEAGASPAQEIAAALACGVHYLRALGQAGMPIDGSSAAIVFTFSVGPDVLIETAKLRALRLCWARIMEASGAAPASRAARIHAVTSRRMLTRYDAWTNIVRVTCAGFAAAIGGADAITALPFTDALGRAAPFARRLARNTQHVLAEESHLGRVRDPAGGAWFVEKLTRELAQSAWEQFQALEAQGGIVSALTNGALQRDIAEARAARAKTYARRSENITGLTDYPLLRAEPPAIDESIFAPAKAFAGPMPARDVSAEPLAPMRWAEPFEALRDRAAISKSAKIFSANLGPLQEFSARAQFARNLLGAGGLAAIGPEQPYEIQAALIAAFKQSGARVAVICGADARYLGEAEAAARALKAAGADWLSLAGHPGDREGALSAAGVDQFLYAGQDALAALETLHAALGIGA